MRAHVRALLLALGLFSGCATNGGDAPAIGNAFDSRTLVYDTLVLEFESSDAAVENVRIEGAGEAAVEGAKMMLAAPLGCLGAGMFAALCLAAAPFFPAIAASRAQEPAISRRDMQALAERIATTRFDERLRASVAAQAAQAALPVRDAGKAVGRIVLLRLELLPMEFHHSGYKNGSIDVIQPYLFQLLGHDGTILTELRGRQRGNYRVDDWSLEDAAELRSSLDEWIARIAERGIRLTLLEWQPRLVLAPLSPQPQSKRNWIGIRQEIWPFAESTAPTLRWQRLEEVLPPELVGDISDVSYELEVSGYGGAEHYSVDGLPDPTHSIELELAPCTRYSWRPRARFRFQGALHTTSFRWRLWAPEIELEDHYQLLTPGPDCREALWRQEPYAPGHPQEPPQALRGAVE